VVPLGNVLPKLFLSLFEYGYTYLTLLIPVLNLFSQNEDVQTEPPPRANFADTVNQWVIYDAYVSYEYMKEMQEEKEKSRSKKDETNHVKNLVLF
jgi:hypothetical protein